VTVGVPAGTSRAARTLLAERCRCRARCGRRDGRAAGAWSSPERLMDGAKAAAWVPAKASGRGGGQLRPHAHTVPSLASAQEPWLPAASVTCGDRFCHHSAAKRTSNGGSRLTHGACAAEAAFASVRSASGWLARASAPRAGCRMAASIRSARGASFPAAGVARCEGGVHEARCVLGRLVLGGLGRSRAGVRSRE